MDGTIQSYVTSYSAEEGYAGRIEVVSGPSGRRRWPEHVKAEIVLERYRDGVSVADVTRKHGISGPQLHAWQRVARVGVLPMPDDEMLGLVPVVVSTGDDDSSDGGEPREEGAGVEMQSVALFLPDEDRQMAAENPRETVSFQSLVRVRIRLSNSGLMAI